MIRSFKYKAQINKQTSINLDIWLDYCRTIYNLGLEQRKYLWKSRKQCLSYYTQKKDLKDFKKEFPEFKFVDAQCLRDPLEKLEIAYKLFYSNIKKKKKAGTPRFKSKDRYKSISLYQNSWKLKDNKLVVRNLGTFKLHLSRPIEGNIKKINIKRITTSKIFVTFVCDNIPEKDFPKTNKSVGIDVGIENFCTDSDGKVFGNLRFFESSQKNLRKAQRSLSRKKKGSNKRSKQKLLVAKQYETIRNQRQDFLHKTSRYYINNYQNIYIEDLKIQNMMQNNFLNKQITDVGWYMFSEMLEYKAEEAGRTVKKINPKNTSQICNQCGNMVKKTLNERKHKCKCGLEVSRDYNAALNILSVGQSDSKLTYGTSQSVLLELRSN